MLGAEDRRSLRELARDAIAHGLAHGAPLPVDLATLSPALRARRASFVTLTETGVLRGCIGALEARLPLAEDVALHAYAAAFEDPRFPPLRPEEAPMIDIHISVLAPPEPLPATSEQEALAALRPGEDGLILEEDGRRATFLPSVWASLPRPADFLRQLKLKAGLPADYWSPRLRLQRYRVEEFD